MALTLGQIELENFLWNLNAVKEMYRIENVRLVKVISQMTNIYIYIYINK